jgi:hypothetical protein
MSTLLTDLDSSPAVSSKDGDLVDQILKEMNGPPLPPPAQVQNTAMNSYTMSTNPATAHVIGGAHPTPADFAAAIHGVPPSSAMYTAAAAAAPAAAVPAYRPSKKSYVQRVGDEFKIPIMVAILFFVFSLPVTNVLFAHYLPWTILTTGQLKTTGLLVKSLIAGSTFWVLQRVVVPLFSQ